MDIQTQELKHKLRTAWKSYKAFLGGAPGEPQEYNGDALTILPFLINGTMLPFNDKNICGSADNMNCLQALRGCINGVAKGDSNADIAANFNQCKKFVSSSTFLKKLHEELTKDTPNKTYAGLGSGSYNNKFKEDNETFKIEHNLGSRAARLQQIENILGSLGIETVPVDLNGINSFDFAGHYKGVFGLTGTSADDDLKRKLPNLDNLKPIIKYLMRIHLALSSSTAKYNGYIEGKNNKFINRSSNKPGEYKPVSLFGLMEPEKHLATLTFPQHANLVQNNTNSILQLIRLFSGYSLIGGSSLLHRNNIYSSINFEQTGGLLTSDMSRIRNILTRYISSGLIGKNIMDLLDHALEHLNKKGKSFDRDDIEKMKKNLVVLQRKELEYLKHLVYINEIFKAQGEKLFTFKNNEMVYNQEGGATNSGYMIMKKLSEHVKKSDLSEQLHGMTKFIDELKTEVAGVKSNIKDVEDNIKDEIENAKTSIDNIVEKMKVGVTIVDKEGKLIDNDDEINISMRNDKNKKYDLVDVIMNVNLSFINHLRRRDGIMVNNMTYNPNWDIMKDSIDMDTANNVKLFGTGVARNYLINWTNMETIANSFSYKYDEDSNTITMGKTKAELIDVVNSKLDMFTLLLWAMDSDGL